MAFTGMGQRRAVGGGRVRMLAGSGTWDQVAGIIIKRKEIGNLSAAKRRLASFGDRVIFISSSLEKRWDEKIEHPDDFITSFKVI